MTFKTIFLVLFLFLCIANSVSYYQLYDYNYIDYDYQGEGEHSNHGYGEHTTEKSETEFDAGYYRCKFCNYKKREEKSLSWKVTANVLEGIRRFTSPQTDLNFLTIVTIGVRAKKKVANLK